MHERARVHSKAAEEMEQTGGFALAPRFRR